MYIKFEEQGLNDWVVYAEFRKKGKNDVILESPNGEKSVFEIDIGSNTYIINKK